MIACGESRRGERPPLVAGWRAAPPRRWQGRMLAWITAAIMIVGSLAAAWPIAPLAAQRDTLPTVRPIDVVIVLDDSLSMAICWPQRTDLGEPKRSNCRSQNMNEPSDPSGLRYSAARLLVQLADSDDRMAVVRFDAQVETIGPNALRAVGAGQDRAALIASLQAPTNYQGRSQTHIDYGLARARELLTERSDQDRPAYILFLSDGEPEPGADSQRVSVMQSLATLQQHGVRVLPVALCNDGVCPNAFLKETMGDVEEAATPAELLEIFSRLFAEMKPNLHILRRSGSGNLDFRTLQAQGARQLNIVTTAANYGGLTRVPPLDKQPELAYTDPNVAVYTLDSGGFPDATWGVASKGQGFSDFVVARTDTYPEVIHPPAAESGVANSPHYAPARKNGVLIAATTVGPGLLEPLLLDRQAPLKGLDPDGKERWVTLPTGTERLELQVGVSQEPLVVRRSFELRYRDDLPIARAETPTCAGGEPCTLRIEFEPGAALENLQGTVYVAEQAGTSEQPRYRGAMTCAGRQCTNDGFRPEPGRSYIVRYLVQAKSNGILFGDWDETVVTTRPLVTVRNLPNPINPLDQPANGWPATVTARTSADLGRLNATLTLKRDNTPVAGGGVLFSVDIRGNTDQQANLRIQLPQDLPPGQYSGQITFAVERPPQDLVLPAPIDLFFAVGRRTATFTQRALDFPTVGYSTSPNWKIDARASVDVQFTPRDFPVAPKLESSTCADLELSNSPEERQPNGSHRIELRLRSSGPLQPQSCSGTISWRGQLNEDVIAPSNILPWRLEIRRIEWSVLGATGSGGSAPVPVANVPPFGIANEQREGAVLVRYDGDLPFKLQVSDFQVTTEHGDTAALGQQLAIVLGNPEPVADQPNIYRVPFTLVATDDLGTGLFRGRTYRGQLRLAVAGLNDQSVGQVGIEFRNPSGPERYVLPKIIWAYGFWFPGIVTLPLTVFLILLAMTAINSGNEEEEPVQQDRVEQEDDPPPPVVRPGPRPPGRGGWGPGRPPIPLSRPPLPSNPPGNGRRIVAPSSGGLGPAPSRNGTRRVPTPAVTSSRSSGTGPRDRGQRPAEPPPPSPRRSAGPTGSRR